MSSLLASSKIRFLKSKAKDGILSGLIIMLVILIGLGVSVYNKTIAVNGVTSLGEYSTSLDCVENDFVEMSLQTALQLLVNEISLLKGKIDAL